MPLRDRLHSPLRRLCAVALALVAAAACKGPEQLPTIADTPGITTSGGRANAQSGVGGSSGEIRFALDHGGAGTIEMRQSGVVDASFTPTMGVPIDLGPTSLVVSTDTIVTIPMAEPTVGTPYSMLNVLALFVSDGNGTLGDETPVSGLEIQPGATLTLPINSMAMPGAELDFTHDIIVDGVLTVADVDASARGSIDLFSMGSYFGAGRIETHGTLPGQSGGTLSILVEGAVYNSGELTSYGADNIGADGGDGGEIQIRTDDQMLGDEMENTGRIDSHGGAAMGGSGSGGDAGPVSLIPYRALWNAGDVVATGGRGIRGGGVGGDVLLAGYYCGELLNTGHITTDGGDTVSGTAGGGGRVSLQARGAGLESNAQLSSRGGRSEGPGGVGGAGGDIEVYVTSSDDTWEPAPVMAPAGDLWLSGPIDTSGGAAMGPGGVAGAGGGVAFEIENDVTMGAQSIRTQGHGRLVAQGGNGFVGGPSRGLVADVSSSSGTPTGSIVVDPPVDSSGGDANPGTPGSMGGDAGDIDLTARTITLGDYTVSGGTGTTPGANGMLITSP